jgi:hypothetical protein
MNTIFIISSNILEFIYMGNLLVKSSAQLTCSFGCASSVLNVIRPMTICESLPLGNISDCIPLVNIMPFGMCTTESNPEVAAETAAALGVPTPAVCIPVIPAPWIPKSPTITVDGMAVLTKNSKCMCAWGGEISIINSGVTKSSVG